MIIRYLKHTLSHELLLHRTQSTSSKLTRMQIGQAAQMVDAP
jgi:hypothetical protein